VAAGCLVVLTQFWRGCVTNLPIYGSGSYPRGFVGAGEQQH
jgi:hypothetical protein